MKDNVIVSIIIRTKNEERWITEVLKLVFKQEFKDFEVIIVDNNSTDKTIAKAEKFDVKIVTIDQYLPGKALNIGIRAAKGNYIVCLSAHCLPVNEKWLGNLVNNFTSKDIAGVYGRQLPMTFSSAADKRDLLIAFGLDKKVQVNDSFFHNANSIIRRDLWEETPFDESLTNIEDRVWAKKMIEQGYKLVYEPEAGVYHYHGIHQDGDAQRCAGVVKILEDHDSLSLDDTKQLQRIHESHVSAFIPIQGEPQYLANRPLIEYTIEHAFQSQFIKDVFVLTDNYKVKKIVEKMGAVVPYLREKNKEQSLDQVLQEALVKIETKNIFPDIITVMWETFPFRESAYIDKLITEFMNRGVDSVISVKPIFESCWQEKQSNQYIRLDSGNVPREKRKKFFVGIEGLGYVTYPDCIRSGNVYGEQIGIVEVHNPISCLKVKESQDFPLAEQIAQEWFVKKKVSITI